MTEDEKDIWKSIPTQHPKYWVPCVWFTNLIRLSRKQGRIQSDPAMTTIMNVSFLPCKLTLRKKAINVF